MAITVEDVRQQIFNWIDLILRVEGGETIPIVLSHQSLPPPVGEGQAPYMVISQWPVRRREEGGTVGTVDDQGYQTIYNYYEDVWTLEEVNGSGDRLRVLIESQGRQDIHDRFAAVGIAYREQVTEIAPFPEEVQGEWRYRHAVDIRIGLVSTLTYRPGDIATVEYQGAIGGKTI